MHRDPPDLLGSHERRASVMPGAADALVIGSGPNGIAAAIRLAQARQDIAVYATHERWRPQTQLLSTT